MENAKYYFSQFLKLNETEWKKFESKFKLVSYPKKTLLIKEGDYENYIYFIKSGILRHYLIHDGKDHTFAFKFQNEFASSYRAFITRTPSDIRIETLTNVEMWAMHYEDLNDFYNTTKIGNAMGRIAAENLFLEKFKRELSLLNKDAEARYLEMFEDYNDLLHKIPQKYLASYIGVTPQSLSRIKRKLFTHETSS